MRNSLSGLSLAFLGVMISIVLVSGGVIFSLRGLEKAIRPFRDTEYIPREKTNTASPLVHGYWVFDRFDNTDYRDTDPESNTRAIYPETNAEPEQYKGARYYSCNIEDSGNSYYWASFQEIDDAAQFRKFFSALNSSFPFTLIRNRYDRFYNDKEYDKRNRSRFFKMFGLPDPNNFDQVIVMNASDRFREEIPTVGAKMDRLEVKAVDRKYLVLTYKDSEGGSLDLVYKNESRLPQKPLSYSVYFKGK